MYRLRVIKNNRILKLLGGFIVLVHFIISHSAFSQSKTIAGKIVDETTQLPIPNVGIQIHNTLIGTFSDSLGLFELTITDKNTILLFSTIGYEKQAIDINRKTSLPLLVELRQSAYSLDEVTINASLVEVVYQKKQTNILDYEFQDDYILLITFWNNLSKSNVVVLDKKFDTLYSVPYPHKPLGFYKDCLGNNHIVCKDSVFQLFYHDNRLLFYKGTSLDAFQKILFPCIASSNSNLYLVEKYGKKAISTARLNFDSNNHGLAYYFINKENLNRKLLTGITNETAKKQKAEEVEYLNYKNAKGFYRTTHGMDFDRVFSEKILFSEIYAPLYVIEDTVYVFDYINGKIISYDAEGNRVSTKDINYHLINGWKFEMYQDVRVKEVYTLYQKNGINSIHKVDYHNGILQNEIKIPYPFTEKIKVHNNCIYFLYRENNMNGVKYLSRVKIVN
jgi:hypothetical protein